MTLLDSLVVRFVFHGDIEKLDRINEKIEGTKKRLNAVSETFGRMGLATGALGAGLVTKALQIERDWSAVAASTGLTINELKEQYTGFARGLSNETGAAVQDVQWAIQKSISAGVKGQKQIESVVAKAIKAQQLGIGDAAEIISTATTMAVAFGIETSAAIDLVAKTGQLGEGNIQDFASAMKVLSLSSTAMNLGAESMSNMALIASRMAPSVAEGSTAMRGFLDMVLTATAESSQKFNMIGMRAGVTMRQVQDKIFSDDVVGAVELMNKVIGVGKESDEFAIHRNLGRVFSGNTEAAKAYVIMNRQLDDMRKIQNQLMAETIVIDKHWQDALENNQALVFDIAWRQLVNLGDEIGGNLLPGITEFIKGLRDAFRVLNDPDNTATLSEDLPKTSRWAAKGLLVIVRPIQKVASWFGVADTSIAGLVTALIRLTPWMLAIALLFKVMAWVVGLVSLALKGYAAALAFAHLMEKWSMGTRLGLMALAIREAAATLWSAAADKIKAFTSWLVGTSVKKAMAVRAASILMFIRERVAALAAAAANWTLALSKKGLSWAARAAAVSMAVLKGAVAWAAATATAAAGFIGTLALSLKGAATAAWGFTVALLSNPLTWIVVGIIALIAAIVALVVYWDEVKAAFASGWEWVKNSSVGQWFQDTWASFSEAAMSAWDSVKETMAEGDSWIRQNMPDWFVSGWDFYLNAVKTVWSGIIEIVKFAFNSIVALLTGDWGFFADAWQSVKDGAKEAWDYVTGLWGRFKEWLASKLPAKVAGFLGMGQEEAAGQVEEATGTDVEAAASAARDAAQIDRVLAEASGAGVPAAQSVQYGNVANSTKAASVTQNVEVNVTGGQGQSVEAIGESVARNLRDSYIEAAEMMDTAIAE